MEWQYEPTPDFDKTPIERLQIFPRHPDMLVYTARLALNAIARAWLKIYHRYRVVGRDKLAAMDGPFVLVANHSSHLDAICLLSALPLRKIHKTFPAAARDYFFTTLPKSAFFAVAVNAMPFDRKENPRDSLAVCADLLRTPKHVLILFPEGTRTPTGEIGEFKVGIGFLVAGTLIPVVPCYLDGAYRAWPKGAWIPRPRRLRLIVGEPRTFAELEQHTKESARIVASTLRDCVTELERSIR